MILDEFKIMLKSEFYI